VTFLALGAETARMHVVFGVAATADHGGLGNLLRLEVALGAADVGVGAGQGKLGARRMIEVPEFPAVGGVARSAILPQFTLVGVVFCMTADTGFGCLLEVLCRVTLSARDGDVEPEEWVRREVVVEGHVTPFRGGVTGLAGSPQGAAMRVVGAMTAAAVRAEFLFLHDTRVACVTVESRVRAFEREERLVIVSGDPPEVVAMTLAAGGAQPARVAIIRLVATGAVFRDRVVEIAGAVTVGAADVGVSAEQGEARLPGVLKLSRAPVRGRMAVAALLALASFVDVVRGMTGDTFFGGAFIALTRVTGGAGGLNVLVGQWKRCFVVIEVRLLPGLRAMTGAAICSERVVVRVVLSMAADAGVGSFAERHILRVATAAG